MIAGFSTAAQAAIWHVEKGGVSYAVEQSTRGVALLVDNASGSRVSVLPDAIGLYVGKDRFPVCTLFPVKMMGFGVPGVSAGVQPGERSFFMMGDCGREGLSSPAQPLTVAPPLTRISVQGLALSPGEPQISRKQRSARPSNTPVYPPGTRTIIRPGAKPGTWEEETILPGHGPAANASSTSGPAQVDPGARPSP
jgi:hypothetical protein